MSQCDRSAQLNGGWQTVKLGDMNILGLDIGGANIKAADRHGQTCCRPFAIWKDPDRLAGELDQICREFPSVNTLAVTMTAELADCFETKAAGVRFILDQIEAVDGPRHRQVWTTAGEFLAPHAAREQPMAVAAANWHALASWIGSHSPFARQIASSPSALVIDIGTTTTDLIPLVEGLPATIGLTDRTRLQAGELCYSGVRRTPLCAIAHSVPFRDGYCSLAAELFATTLDVYLLLGDIPEAPEDRETANGRPATIAAAHDRIARMLCADRNEVSFEEAVQIARFLADVHQQRLAGAMERVLSRQPKPCESVIVSGSGGFLARRLVEGNHRLANVPVTSLDEILSPAIAEAACAYAVAKMCEVSATPLEEDRGNQPV